MTNKPKAIDLVISSSAAQSLEFERITPESPIATKRESLEPSLEFDSQMLQSPSEPALDHTVELIVSKTVGG